MHPDNVPVSIYVPQSGLHCAHKSAKYAQHLSTRKESKG